MHSTISLVFNATCCTYKYFMFSKMALHLTLFDAYVHNCFTKSLVNGS